jgi:hypothetical protein
MFFSLVQKYKERHFLGLFRNGALQLNRVYLFTILFDRIHTHLSVILI